jgi:diguanylate cyclase (GGDEF)-like protein/PAS domain S-box-containing protein
MSEPASLRVLLIEDNPDDAQLIHRLLAAATDARWEVVGVDRLAAATRALEKEPFDAVLLDLKLPDAQGLEGLRWLRSHSPTVPVIVLTGHDADDAGEEALREGAQDYLVKDRARSSVLSRALRYARERSRTEDALRESEERYRLLVEDAPDIIYRCDERGHFTYVNAAAARAMGYRDDEVLGKHFLELIRPDHREAAAEFYRRQLQERQPLTTYEFPAISRDGGEVWIHQNVQLLPERRGFQAVARDVTERKRLEDDRHRLQQELKQFFELSSEMLATIGLDGRFKQLNAAWSRKLGHQLDELKGFPFVEIIHADDHAMVRVEIERLQERESVSFETRCRCRDESERWILWHVALSREDGLYFAAASDISERKRREEVLIREAGHDALTGLPNRAHTHERLERVLRRAKHDGTRIGVLYVDIDFFKSVNDTMGHAAGDEYLVTVARRLERCLRPGDLVGRLGGDEFLVVLDRVDEEKMVQRIAERVQRALHAPFAIDGQEVVGGASIGGALSSPRHERPMDLLRDADAAMYQAKTAGRGRVVLWREGADATPHREPV